MDNKTLEILEKGKYIHLLEKSLPEKSHPNYSLWKDFCLMGIKRGRDFIDFISKYRDIKDAVILDYGCGDGGHSVACAEKGATVFGIDVDKERLEKAKALAGDFGVTVDFRYDNNYGESLPSNHFDIIICNDVIEHVESFSSVAESHKRLLKNNGLLFIEVPNRWSIHLFIKDGHYHMFGINILGPAIAGFYVTKIRKRAKTYDVNRSLGWFEIHKIYKKAGINLYCITKDKIETRISTGDQKTLFKKILAKILPNKIIIPFFLFLWTPGWEFMNKPPENS